MHRALAHREKFYPLFTLCVLLVTSLTTAVKGVVLQIQQLHLLHSV